MTTSSNICRRHRRGPDDRFVARWSDVRDLAQHRTYRDKPVDTQQIGRELGVRYVLEGSVQRLGSQLRVSAQLSDAENAANLWAERFDSDTGDLFAVQNEITRRIAVALNLELIRAEAARPTKHPDALDYILRGRAILMKPATPDNRAEPSLCSIAHLLSIRSPSRPRAG